MKPLTLTLTLALACALATSARATACDLDCSLTRELRAQQLAGAVYVLVDGDTTRSGALGLSNAAAGEAMRPDSKVQVGSVTKTLVALGTLRLVAQGRVSLDAPVAELLPDLRFDNPWHATTPVTLRHLLDHTAGLDDLRLWQMFSTGIPPRAPLRQAFDRAPELLRVRVEPGSHFSYANTGYTLVGMVIESVTGERYESWLDRELLGPLGMRDSTFEYTSQTGAHADPRLAWGHFEDFRPAAAQPFWVRPATQFATTADDMARLARFLMSDGRIGEQAFIPDALLRQMGRAQGTAAARAGLEAGYALGLARRDRHGAVGLCHPGNTVGFAASLCVYPEHRKAFFIAHNSDTESARYERFDALLVRELGVSTPAMPAALTPQAPTPGSVREPGREPRSERQLEPESPPESWQGRYVAWPSRFETFRYFDALFETVTLRIDHDAIELRRMGAEPQRLIPVGPHLYRAEDRRLASHVLLNEAGTISFSNGTRSFRRIETAAFLLNWASLALGLAGLIVFLVLIPWRAWRRREPLWQPAAIAWLLLLLPAPLFASQSFMKLGNLTPASASLYLATLGLPILMAAQVLWALRHRDRLRSWPVHVAAAALVLQWCVSLHHWDLLPFALWR